MNNHSLLCFLQIVKEYERAIIFRFGRILKGGAKGPGEDVMSMHEVLCIAQQLHINYVVI